MLHTDSPFTAVVSTPDGGRDEVQDNERWALITASFEALKDMMEEEKEPSDEEFLQWPASDSPPETYRRVCRVIEEEETTPPNVAVSEAPPMYPLLRKSIRNDKAEEDVEIDSNSPPTLLSISKPIEPVMVQSQTQRPELSGKLYHVVPPTQDYTTSPQGYTQHPMALEVTKLRKVVTKLQHRVIRANDLEKTYRRVLRANQALERQMMKSHDTYVPVFRRDPYKELPETPSSLSTTPTGSDGWTVPPHSHQPYTALPEVPALQLSTNHFPPSSDAGLQQPIVVHHVQHVQPQPYPHIHIQQHVEHPCQHTQPQPLQIHTLQPVSVAQVHQVQGPLPTLHHQLTLDPMHYQPRTFHHPPESQPPSPQQQYFPQQQPPSPPQPPTTTYTPSSSEEDECEFAVAVEKLRMQHESLLKAARVKAASCTLQRVIQNGPPRFVESVIQELLPGMAELGFDFFGNYVVKMAVQEANDNLMFAIFSALTPEFPQLSVSTSGTRIAQLLLDRLEEMGSQYDIRSLQEALVASCRGQVLRLIKNEHGTHVIQKAATVLSPSNSIMYSEIQGHLSELCVDKQGICAVQHLFKASSGAQREGMVQEIVQLARGLVNHQYGNYAVQCLLEHRSMPVLLELCYNILPILYESAKNKFGSNVVEKLLKRGCPQTQQLVIRELTPHSIELLTDSYGNYTIQAALHTADSPELRKLTAFLQDNIALVKEARFGRRVVHLLKKITQ